MKQALLILSFLCIPTFGYAHDDESHSQVSEEHSWALTAQSLVPVVGIFAAGFFGMRAYPEHGKRIGIGTLAALVAYGIYAPKSFFLAIGPTYCVGAMYAGNYFGIPFSCPCCPPGCNYLMPGCQFINMC